MMEKNIVRAKVVAGTQRAKHITPHMNVSVPAVFTLENRSLTKPVMGLPIAVPIFKKPTISVAWLRESPIAIAKSDRENSRVIYPNMLTNAHSNSNITAFWRSSLKSRAIWVGLIWRFLSRIKSAAMTVATAVTSPVMRRDQAKPRCCIMAAEPQEKIAPPIPEPAELIPLTTLRLLRNHWERTAVLGMMMKPIPQPTRRPCER
jgi:hypothetical protein